ncbi:cellulase (glycosyl hydrolase family 5) [uncultured Ruminococcus sp.]|uniref:cellulase (glycosyl hydrolase family 5) n=1 Tax=uncultured Ruminococcus sp. TaxID=165186 RepID=UPI0026666F48|nr:cellulase (glycosyl hydrolase family 5) [uncultured Ruminococcus sp.]
MKVKKWLASSLAVLMLVSTAGCGDSSSSSKADNSSSSASGGAGTSYYTPVVPEAAMPEKDYETTTDGSARVTVDGTKFMVGDKELWFNGVNSPWDKWNDFGGGFNFEFWQDHFQKLHNSGVNAARIWVVCNGDVGMLISADGTFDGATTAHWEDLDNLFYLAEQYQIYIMATVQSFDNFKDSNQNYNAWRALIQDSDKTDRFVDNYIVPFVQRYGKSDYFWSVDLCNEPDWIVENEECGKLDWLYLEQYYAKAAAAIHANSDVLVTVGMGMIKYNSDSQQGNKISDSELQSTLSGDKYDKSLAYVDFYSTHWYTWMQGMWGYPFGESPTDFGLDGTKPSVIGECPAVASDSDFDITSAYEEAYNNGWNGVFAWKTSGQDDGCGLWLDIQPAIEKMAGICEDKIFPNGKKAV